LGTPAPIFGTTFCWVGKKSAAGPTPEAGRCDRRAATCWHWRSPRTRTPCWRARATRPNSARCARSTSADLFFASAHRGGEVGSTTESKGW